MPDLKVPDWAKANFDTLQQAHSNSHLALLSAVHKATGEVHYLLTAVSWDGEMYNMTPLARMLDENPFEAYEPPGEDDGTNKDGNPEGREHEAQEEGASPSGPDQDNGSDDQPDEDGG